MAIKDQTMTTETAADGTEFVSEINAVITETAPDGTETVAEITTTASEDDPTEIEGHITITETAPDGTETVTEITAAADGTMTIEEDESLIEEVVEALFDVEVGDDAEISPKETAGEFEIVESDAQFQTNNVDFTVGDEMFDPNALPPDIIETPFTDAPLDSVFGTADAASFETADAAFSATPIVDTSFDSAFGTAETDSVDAETLAREAHAQAATDAQASADEFIAAGDYAAAAEAREVAENESWEAGDDSILSAYDASDLALSAEKQEEAEYYNEQQATLAQQGDYEGAREAADNSAYATYEADSTVGGDDHTGQADAEKHNMDNAVWQEGLAADDVENAAYHAEMGDFEAADSSLDSAAYHQKSADHYGDLGEHGGEIAVYDPSSVVETGGTYDSSFDSSVAAVDTGFDSGMDTSMNSGLDSGADDI